MRRGVLLVEALLALLVIVTVGMALTMLFVKGAHAGARAGGEQIAARTAARALDAAVAPGYRQLAPLAGALVQIDLAESAECDGLLFVALAEIAEAAPGLLRISLAVYWRPAGDERPQSVHVFRVERLVGDPGAAIHVREPVAGGQA